MTSPAWKGSTATGVCPLCGHVETVMDPEVLRSPEKHDRGHCSVCDRQVEWIIWDGPVMPR